MKINSNNFQTYFELFKKKIGYTSGSNFSVFKFSSEFANFLKNDMGLDTSLESLSISDIIKQNIIDAQKKDNPNTEDDSILANFLSGLLEDTDFIKSIDANNDGEIDEGEMNNFFNAIDGDGNSNLSIDELFSGLDKLKDGSLDSILGTSFSADKPETPKTPPNGSGDGGGTDPTLNTDNTPKDLNKMTEEELSAEKNKRNDTLKAAEDSLKTLRSDGAKKVDEKKAAYDEAVKNDAQISDELKAKKEENDNKIKEKETSIKDHKSDISNQKSEIFNFKTEIAAEQSTLDGLKAAFESLPQKGSGEDEEENAKLEARRQELDSQIKEKEKVIADKNKELEDKESKLQELETTLSTEEEELAPLKEARTKIEGEIAANASDETKTALAEYQAARTDYESKEAEAIKAVEDAQKAVDEVNTEVNGRNTKKVEKDNKLVLGNSLAENPFGDVEKYNAQWIKDETSAPFMLVTPEGIEDYKDIPVVVCYPGSGGICSGENAQRDNQNSFTNSILEQAGENAPKAIFIIMQTNHTNSWTSGQEDVVKYTQEALQYVRNNYNIDENNISATGHSLGGDGVRYVAQQAPDLFTSKRLASISPSTANGGKINNEFLRENFDVKLYSGWRDSDSCYNNGVWLANHFYGKDSFVTSGGGHGDAIKSAMQHNNNRNRRNDLDNNNTSDYFEYLLLGKRA